MNPVPFTKCTITCHLFHIQTHHNLFKNWLTNTNVHYSNQKQPFHTHTLPFLTILVEEALFTHLLDTSPCFTSKLIPFAPIITPNLHFILFCGFITFFTISYHTTRCPRLFRANHLHQYRIITLNHMSLALHFGRSDNQSHMPQNLLFIK